MNKKPLEVANGAYRSTVKKQTHEAEIKKSIFFANSSPEAIVHLVQKALFTYL